MLARLLLDQALLVGGLALKVVFSRRFDSTVQRRFFFLGFQIPVFRHMPILPPDSARCGVEPPWTLARVSVERGSERSARLAIVAG